MSQHAGPVGIIGTLGAFALGHVSTLLGILCSVCTLIVVAPKALEQLRAWRDKYGPIARQKLLSLRFW